MFWISPHNCFISIWPVTLQTAEKNLQIIVLQNTIMTSIKCFGWSVQRWPVCPILAQNCLWHICDTPFSTLLCDQSLSPWPVIGLLSTFHTEGLFIKSWSGSTGYFGWNFDWGCSKVTSLRSVNIEAEYPALLDHDKIKKKPILPRLGVTNYHKWIKTTRKILDREKSNLSVNKPQIIALHCIRARRNNASPSIGTMPGV